MPIKSLKKHFRLKNESNLMYHYWTSELETRILNVKIIVHTLFFVHRNSIFNDTFSTIEVYIKTIKKLYRFTLYSSANDIFNKFEWMLFFLCVIHKSNQKTKMRTKKLEKTSFKYRGQMKWKKIYISIDKWIKTTTIDSDTTKKKSRKKL